MRPFSTLLLGALVPSALAHITFTNFFINGKPETDGKCIRMSQTPDNATFPVQDVASQDMACGFFGDIGMSRVCPISAGDDFTFEFRRAPWSLDIGTIVEMHHGPCAVYMKKVDDASASGNAAGPGWFKVWQEDHDATTDQWCVQKLNRTDDGRLTITIPKDIESGHYLLRSEVTALHFAAPPTNDPQFFIGCAQIFVQNGGTATPPDTVSIPGYVSWEKNRPALSYNVYANPLPLPYPMFGPKPYGTAAASKFKRDALALGRSLPPRASQTTQDTGLTPAGCVLEHGNWCGMEVDPYTTAAGCWAASQACGDQGAQCNVAPNSVIPYANCDAWWAKCRGISDACTAGNYFGPPDHGKVLTPPSRVIDHLPAVRPSIGIWDTGSGSAALAVRDTAVSGATSNRAAAAAPALAPAPAAADPASSSTSAAPAATSSAAATAVAAAGQPGTGSRRPGRSHNHARYDLRRRATVATICNLPGTANNQAPVGANPSSSSTSAAPATTSSSAIIAAPAATYSSTVIAAPAATSSAAAAAPVAPYGWPAPGSRWGGRFGNHARPAGRV